MADQITALDYEVSSQFAHFGMAAFLVAEAGRLGKAGLIMGAVVMLGFAGWKEFVWDAEHESPLIRGSSLLDFGMYVAGILTALGLWFI